jgi:hypothetical protein
VAALVPESPPPDRDGESVLVDVEEVDVEVEEGVTEEEWSEAYAATPATAVPVTPAATRAPVSSAVRRSPASRFMNRPFR